LLVLAALVCNTLFLVLLRITQVAVAAVHIIQLMAQVLVVLAVAVLRGQVAAKILVQMVLQILAAAAAAHLLTVQTVIRVVTAVQV
jgi:hypothetical protein